ncbi:MAG: TIGR02300 family protein [Alphaproteobacteria bacterium]|nr:TIGR02300 family protein [Alphaproteobacteria bacterium]
MAKPEWGAKRTCVSCGARFYDLMRTPATCPKCGTEQPAEQPRLKRGGSSAVAEEKLKRRLPVPEAEAVEEDAAEEIVEGDEEEVLEDTSDLEGEDAGLSDVIDVDDAEKPGTDV